jgi:phosphoserine phosphatase RsbU/P
MNQLNALPPDDILEDFDDFFEHALSGFVLAQPDGKIIRANARLAEWIGCAPDDLVQRRFSDLLSVGGRIYYETHLGPLLRMQGFFDEVALELKAKDDKRLPILLNALERRNDSNEPMFVRITVFKATDRRRYERTLQEDKKVAENHLADEMAVSALREQFVAVLGHDLRNPLAAIRSGVRLLEREQLSERSAKITGLVEKSVQRMSELIDGIMDFARARLGGGFVLDVQERNIEPDLMHVVNELKSAWPERTIEVEFDLTRPVACDVARISQLFSNLLSNALAHGSAAHPVRVSAFSSEEAFQLSVSNSGEPIDAVSHEKLFQPFTRNEVRHSQQGLGLGLYIASEIAKAHNGEISVRSSSEETIFTFTITGAVRRAS